MSYEMKKQLEELEADWRASDYPFDVEPEPDTTPDNPMDMDDSLSECELNDSCEDHGNSGDVHIMDWD